MIDEPASPEEAANRQAAGWGGVAVAVGRLEAECREQAERLRVAYDELDAARAARARAETALHAVLAALRAGVPLPPEVLDDVTQLAAEAYEQSRADRAELVRERDEARRTQDLLASHNIALRDALVRIRDMDEPSMLQAAGTYRSLAAHALDAAPATGVPSFTRADVEARLAGASRPAIADAAADLHYGEGTRNEDACIVNLVCAVLGVPLG